MSEKRDVQLTVRAPEDLVRWIKQEAKEDRRTMSDWIVVQLLELKRRKEDPAGEPPKPTRKLRGPGRG